MPAEAGGGTAGQAIAFLTSAAANVAVYGPRRPRFSFYLSSESPYREKTSRARCPTHEPHFIRSGHVLKLQKEIRDGST
jgi:hypothetical protein